MKALEIPLLARLVCTCATLASFSAGAASDDEWIRLQTPSFGMVSQLDEDVTRRRANEFSQFVEALRQLYTIDDAHLPPLSIVLFDRERDFAPYRTRTESGQSEDVTGFFGNAVYWSVIGMYGRNSPETTRRTIYHEATHWLLSSSQVESPLWFKEGIAEVFSTFAVRNGRAEWGLPLANHIAYLKTAGLQPLEQFLRATQDEAIHELDTYYPQAWAFVHYLLYGNAGRRRAQLQDFLDKQRTLPLSVAFQDAFGMSYDDMNAALRRYLEDGDFAYEQADAPAAPPDTAMEFAAADAGSVEFALARLAAVGGNNELALTHARNLIAWQEERPEGYEVLAHALSQTGDAAGLSAALNRAVALGSTDARVLLMKAQITFNANLRPDAEWPDEALPPEVARQAADYYSQALHIRPDNAAAMRGMVLALLSARTVAESDAAVLEVLATVFPNDGTPLFGKAILAHLAGDAQTANALLTGANREPRRLPEELEPVARAVQQRWYGAWLRASIEALAAERRFAEARVWLDEQAVDTNLTEDQRETLRMYRAEIASYEAIETIRRLIEAGAIDEARTQLLAIANNPANSANVRLAARQLLTFLNR